MRFRPRPVWLLIGFAYFSVEGLLNFGYKYFDVLAREGDRTWLVPMLEELTGSYGSGLLLLGVIPFALRFRFRRGGAWARTLVAHLVGALTFSVLHTTWMAVSREILFPIAGLGSYDYGLMVYRYPMEAFNDLVSYATTLVVVHLVAHAIESRRRERAAARLESQLQQARLENLRMQVQPHFLFNTLNAISNLVYRDAAAADHMLARLADLLRLTLERLDQRHALERELEIVEGYLELMALRYPDRLSWRIDVGRSVRELEVPSLVLQPLVENAVVHAVARSRLPTRVEITATTEGDRLELRVADDGPGLAAGPDGEAPQSNAPAAEVPHGAMPAHGGVGWRSVADRLDTLYEGRARFELGSRAGGGTVAIVSLPATTVAAREPEPFARASAASPIGA
ncbi:MAG TPA: histidine kinase [Thermoanaerobaculia bacterium]|nr:histidine kinase [Thermoanaerobaculia bacterium]